MKFKLDENLDVRLVPLLKENSGSWNPVEFGSTNLRAKSKKMRVDLDQFTNEMGPAAAVSWYEQGKISQG